MRQADALKTIIDAVRFLVGDGYLYLDRAVEVGMFVRIWVLSVTPDGRLCLADEDGNEDVFELTDIGATEILIALDQRIGRILKHYKQTA